VAGDNIAFPLPTVESGLNYAPGSLAKVIDNLQLTSEGTLRTVRGPCPLIPDYGAGYPYSSGIMHGVYHALLHDGMRDVTLIRAGSNLYEQTGWNRSVRTLATGLSSDPTSKYPDQFVEVAGKIVWTNGVDTPLIYDGYKILPLGYERAPGTGTVRGPSDTGHPAFRNNGGYSHPGRIGSAGNFFTQQSGMLLQGAWYYYVQYEDAFGNLSPLSSAFGPVVVRQEITQDSFWLNYNNYPGNTLFDQNLGLLAVKVDDLTKQFYVDGISTGPDGTVARRVYRTADTARNPPDPRFLVRIPDNVTTGFPDNTPDGGLGAVAEEYITVPTFQVMCVHQGRLVIATGGRVRVSDPGFPGTFKRDRYVDPDPEGDITGLVSFNGQLLAFSLHGIFVIRDDGRNLRAEARSTGKGCSAPSSLRATALGLLIWQGQQTFYGMAIEGDAEDIMEEDAALFERLVPSRLSRSVAVWNPSTREYLCAVPEGGKTASNSVGNILLLAYDGKGWRRQHHNIAYASMCVTKDWRRYVLGAGKGAQENVFVLDHEHRSFSPPTKTSSFKSAWLRMDPKGRLRFNVDAIYIGFVEATGAATTTVTWWQNGSRDTAVVAGGKAIEAGNPNTPFYSTTDLPRSVVLGTTKIRDPRLTWKKVPVRIVDVESFAFDVVSTADSYFMEIAGFSFDGYLVDDSGARVSEQ
jgi:hypothetical protein